MRVPSDVSRVPSMQRQSLYVPMGSKHYTSKLSMGSLAGAISAENNKRSTDVGDRPSGDSQPSAISRMSGGVGAHSRHAVARGRTSGGLGNNRARDVDTDVQWRQNTVGSRKTSAESESENHSGAAPGPGRNGGQSLQMVQ